MATYYGNPGWGSASSNLYETVIASNSVTYTIPSVSPITLGVEEPKKRVRKKKTYPPFYNMPTQKTVLESVYNNIFLINSINYPYNRNRKTVSPHSPLIPLVYLSIGNLNIRGNTLKRAHIATIRGMISKLWSSIDVPQAASSEKFKKTADKFRKNIGMLGEILFHIYNPSTIGGELKSALKDVTSEWLEMDRPIHLEALQNASRYTNGSSEVSTGFLSPLSYIGAKFNMRSYYGFSSFLSTFLNPHGDFSNIPVIAVVLPENYIYQKFHMLLHGTIDLRRVVVLVDRELDSTDYHIPAYRAIYKRECEPFLKTLACDVWKVPMSYIIENCFLSPIKFEAKNLEDLTIEKAEMVRSFYDHLASEAPLNQDIDENGNIILNNARISIGQDWESDDFEPEEEEEEEEEYENDNNEYEQQDERESLPF